jgi:hypothetical protein
MVASRLKHGAASVGNEDVLNYLADATSTALCLRQGEIEGTNIMFIHGCPPVKVTVAARLAIRINSCRELRVR